MVLTRKQLRKCQGVLQDHEEEQKDPLVQVSDNGIFQHGSDDEREVQESSELIFVQNGGQDLLYQPVDKVQNSNYSQNGKSESSVIQENLPKKFSYKQKNKVQFQMPFSNSELEHDQEQENLNLHEDEIFEFMHVEINDIVVKRKNVKQQNTFENREAGSIGINSQENKRQDAFSHQYSTSHFLTSSRFQPGNEPKRVSEMGTSKKRDVKASEKQDYKTHRQIFKDQQSNFKPADDMMQQQNFITYDNDAKKTCEFCLPAQPDSISALIIVRKLIQIFLRFQRSYRLFQVNFFNNVDLKGLQLVKNQVLEQPSQLGSQIKLFYQTKQIQIFFYQ
eukprot:403334746